MIVGRYDEGSIACDNESEELQPVLEHLKLSKHLNTIECIIGLLQMPIFEREEILVRKHKVLEKREGTISNLNRVKYVVCILHYSKSLYSCSYAHQFSCPFQVLRDVVVPDPVHPLYCILLQQF
jgi:hypothetical protein